MDCLDMNTLKDSTTRPRRIERKRPVTATSLMSPFQPPQHLLLSPNPHNKNIKKSNLPLKKRPFQGLMNDDNEEDPPPTKLRRLVASYWRMSRLQDPSQWKRITRGPPASGSYFYSEQYPEDEAAWQQRVLEWNTAVTKRTKYQADGIFLPMPTSHVDRKPSPIRPLQREPEDAVTATTLMGPSRRVTAAFDMPIRPTAHPVPLTSLRRIPGADSLSYSTDTVDTTTAASHPLFRNSFNILPPSHTATMEREEEEDDELLVMDRNDAPFGMGINTTKATPHLPSFASVTPSPHFFLHPPTKAAAPRLVRPTPRPSSSAAMPTGPTHWHVSPIVRPHAFRPLAPPTVDHSRGIRPRNDAASEEPPWEHPLRPNPPQPWQWTPVTSAFAPGRSRRPKANDAA